MDPMNEKTKVYNVIIMDRSGSMWSIQKPAINGYNEVLGGVKAAARNYSDTQEQFFTLVLFDSTSPFMHLSSPSCRHTIPQPSWPRC